MLIVAHMHSLFVVFFFNDTATTEIYTLSLHDALPIWAGIDGVKLADGRWLLVHNDLPKDRKSTRLNSSHANISYAVFCLKKKKSSSQFFARVTKILQGRFDVFGIGVGRYRLLIIVICGLLTVVLLFFLMIRRPPRSTLFPYRRSSDLAHRAASARAGRAQSVSVAAAVTTLTDWARSEEHTSELQSCQYLVCRLLLE